MIKRPHYGSYHVGRHACSSDLHLIDGAFTTHMREHGYSSSAIARYRYYLVRVAGWLAVHRRRLTSLSRKELPRLARLMVPKATYHTLFGVLNRWLKFRQRYVVEPREPWASWLSDYGAFLKDHRGFGHLTVEGYVAFARRYLPCVSQRNMRIERASTANARPVSNPALAVDVSSWASLALSGKF